MLWAWESRGWRVGWDKGSGRGGEGSSLVGGEETTERPATVLDMESLKAMCRPLFYSLRCRVEQDQREIEAPGSADGAEIAIGLLVSDPSSTGMATGLFLS